MEETKRIKKKKKHTITVENVTAGEKYTEKWKRNYDTMLTKKSKRDCHLPSLQESESTYGLILTTCEITFQISNSNKR